MIALVVAATSDTRVVRHPRAHHPRRLGHVDRGDPLHDLLVLVDLDLPAVCNHQRSSSRRVGWGCPGLGWEPKR
jgi:hypothetical protein